MSNYVGDIIICTLILLSISLVYGSTQVIKSLLGSGEEILTSSSYYNWIVRLALNLLGYATVLLPGYFIHKYVRHSKYLQREGKRCVPRLVHACFLGSGESGLLDSTHYVLPPSYSSTQQSFSQELLLLLYCFFGLQISYLTWGYLQEKIMTQEYTDNDGNKSHFRDSQFLVFVNRILAFLMSGFYLMAQRHPSHTTPLYKYAFCSLSNVLSSWCQYEALKFVSFPTQVLAKASKIIPVMIMGKFISRNSYEYYEYVTAVIISIGMTMFMLGSSTNSKNDEVTTFSGVLLLAGYMVLDSFTSNWQNSLFTEYGMTSVQMMCAVNMFSCLLTATSLVQQSTFAYSLTFMAKHPRFVMDCLLISICSASGQLYIFYTISKFGAVTFVIIMTIRQSLAILLSCVIYQHPISTLGVLGIILVFLSVFLRIYCNNRLRSIKKRKAEVNSVKD
ncbi:adenosine 3'-phospho 5'-phosphosulfate transporter 1 [Belonocnema kinseyi]|uniref:adenosine 3'-phospho 5'-phosphosulfate transporter 1 n=1 Tax=Belonocnema kinseyi TaxID=2817044 RepID=UPI00143D60BE|nr:adenosine 3'-phospho 5'-phosphosulfate transporter 1 [Belonocnema kinseyi]